MSPLFREGDQLLVSTHADQIEIGDLLYFKDKVNEVLTIHRVISLYPCRTKGDYSLLVDESDINVIGKVIGVRRNNVEIIWGEQGQPLKKYFAYISKMRMSNDLIGKGCLLVLHLLSRVSQLMTEP